MSIKAELSRRQFLQSMTAAGLMAGTSLAALAQDEGEEAEPFRFGLIGAGGQGTHVLLPNSKRIPGMQCVAVCDIRDDSRNHAIEVAGGEGIKGYVEWQEMLAAGGFEAVVIATPLFTHRDIAVAALGAGYHVFCEKCMAYSIDECKDMLRAQRDSGKVLQIGHHLRYHPLYYHAKAAFIGDGLLGKITNVHAQWNRNGDWRRPVPEGDLDYTRWGYEDVEHLVNWRLYKELSGGLTTELASHQTDVMNWLLGETPNAVTGVGGIDYWDDGRTVFDNIHVIYEYPSGVKFSYESLTTNALSPFGECWEMIQGKEGTVVLSHLPHEAPFGIFVLEPGVQERIWMDAAHRLKGIDGVQDERGAILLDATATQGPNKPEIAGISITDLIARDEDEEGNPRGRGLELLTMTYELELREFVMNCRKGLRPTCDGNVGIRSAADAILANQAMEEQRRIAFAEDLYQV